MRTSATIGLSGHGFPARSTGQVGPASTVPRPPEPPEVANVVLACTPTDVDVAGDEAVGAGATVVPPAIVVVVVTVALVTRRSWPFEHAASVTKATHATGISRFITPLA